MAESDALLLLQLRQHGILIGPNTTISGMSPELLFTICRDSLLKAAVLPSPDTTSSGKKLPQKLPSAASARFTVCGALTEELGQAGCKAEYNNLMYPSEEATKNILAWLVQLLGRTADEANAAAARAAEGATQSHSGTTLQKGLRSLEATLAAHTTAAGQSKKKQRQVSSFIPQRQRPKRISRLFVAHPTEMWGGESNCGQQLVQAHLQALKLPALPFQQSWKAPFTQRVSDSVCESNALLRSLEKGFEAQCGVPIPPKALQSPASGEAPRKHKESAVVGGVGTIADCLFFSTGESALSISEAKRAQADAEAVERALAEGEKSVQERGAEREREVQHVQDRLQQLKRALKGHNERLKELEAKIAEKEVAGQDLIAAAEAKLQKAQDHLAVAREKEELLKLMEDPEASMAKLQTQVDELNAQRSHGASELGAKMAKIEAKRDALLEEAAKAGAGRDQQLADLRMQCKAVKRQIRDKATEVTKLEAEYERCPKDIDRSKFLRLIFDMTSNIRRQQEQIDKMRAEITTSETNISVLQKKLSDIFFELETQVFDKAVGSSGSKAPGKKKTEAAPDPFAKESLKRFVELRGAYSTLMGLITERGEIGQEKHGVEEKAGKLEHTVEGYNMNKIESDLQMVESENADLQSKVEVMQE